MTGKEFKEIRKQLKKTQASMADTLKVKPRTIQNWEGEVNTIPDNVILLLQYILEEKKPKTDVNGFAYFEKGDQKVCINEAIDFVLNNSDQALLNQSFRNFIDLKVKDGIIQVLSSDA